MQGQNQIIKLPVVIVCLIKVPVWSGLDLSVSLINYRFLALEIVLLNSEPDEEILGSLSALVFFIVYLLFLIRYFVVNEGRKYTVSAFFNLNYTIGFYRRNQL